MPETGFGRRDFLGRIYGCGQTKECPYRDSEQRPPSTATRYSLHIPGTGYDLMCDICLVCGGTDVGHRTPEGAFRWEFLAEMPNWVRERLVGLRLGVG